jgi:hypothetical protein
MGPNHMFKSKLKMHLFKAAYCMQPWHHFRTSDSFSSTTIYGCVTSATYNTIKYNTIYDEIIIRFERV